MSTAMMTRPASASSVLDEDFWIEMDSVDPQDVICADSVVCVGRATPPAPAPAPKSVEFIELEPPVEVGSQDEMRFGVQTYTPDQARVIELAVRRRRSLDIPPLPIDD